MDSGNKYNEEYYKHNCGPVAYDNKNTIDFFQRAAENIIQNFNPDTVLDVGCAMGHLVNALRERGVNAYGIDISEYAISRVQTEIKSYCKVFSVLDGLPCDFPRKYDLLVTIEVAEHLYEEEGDVYIENICKYSDRIIFSSTPYDIFEKTHYNVQQPEYWGKRFAKNGFFQNLSEKPSYILPQSMLFYKTEDTERVVEDYERNIRMLNQDLAKLQNDFSVLSIDRGVAQEIMDSQAQRLEQLRTDHELLQKDRAKAQEIMDSQQEKYQEILNSMSWKLTKPLRFLSIKIRG